MKKENPNTLLFKLEIEEAYGLYKSGHSLKKVGETYGLSRSTVSRIFKSENKQIKSASESHKKGTSLTKKQQKYILKEIKSKTPLLDIAAALNITYGKLHYFLDLVNAAPGRRFKGIPENEICESYKEGVTIEELRVTYECDWKTIRGVLDRNNVEMLSSSERFTVPVDGLTLICEDLMETPKTLSRKAKELGISKHILKQRLLDDGFALRSQSQEQEIFYREKYPEFDIDFFSRKSELANYWAGFISADGAIMGDPQKKLRLAISLSQKDKGHCQKIQQILKAGTIRQYDASKYSGKIGNKIVRGGKMETYSLSSSKLCRDLIKLGVTP
jgi:hypothetical protein